MSSVLDVRGLGHRYGGAGGHHAIDRLDFAVEPGEFVSIVGPSRLTGEKTSRRVARHRDPAAGGLCAPHLPYTD